MIKIENIDVYGFETAIRGMRNPMNSWEKSDSEFVPWDITSFEIGENDLDLMKRLFKGGTEHRKYMRMINVTMDITAPLYWWKEFDTYKIGTVANSCSTMHKIHAKEFTLDDFSCEHLVDNGIFAYPLGGGWRGLSPIEILKATIELLNNARKRYLIALKTEGETGLPAKDIWWQMIQLLPSSYNQRRTVQMNYEVAANIIRQRKNHKLDEWHIMVDELLNLPYMKEIMGVEHEIN